MSESSTRISKCYAPADSEHKSDKTGIENWLLIGFSLGSFWREPVVITTTLYSTTNGLSYIRYVPLHKVLNNPEDIALPWNCTGVLKSHDNHLELHKPPNRTKTNHHPLNHLQTLHTHTLNYATLLPTCVSGSSQTPGVTKKILDSHIPSLFHLIITRNQKVKT